MEQLAIIEALKHMPDALERELTGRSETVLRYRPAESEWSIREVVGHLHDMARVWHQRLYMVWSQTDPLFESFDGEQSIIEHRYQDTDLRPLIAALREQRRETVELLSEAVDWTRVGQQRGVGRRSLKQFAELVVSHDEEHLAQIRTLKAAAGQQSEPWS